MRGLLSSFRRVGFSSPPLHQVRFATFEAMHAYHELAERGIRPMSFAEYRRVCRRLPPPAAEQVDAFIDAFSRAGSWYKHFPLFLPGVPMHFFITPTAGFDVRFHPGARASVELITPANDSYRRLSRPTARYREQFGYLQYAGRGSLATAADAELPGYCSLPKIAVGRRLSRSAVAHRIPTVIAVAGRVDLTAAIHPEGRLGIAKLQMTGRWPPPCPRGLWPAETGGEFLVRRLAALAGGPAAAQQRALEPERRRQRNAIRAAIMRVLAAIYD